MAEPNPEELLPAALDAARHGDLDRARALATEGLGRASDPVPFHAFLGMLAARDGEPALAATHLRAAHVAKPADVTIACNLIAVLMQTGDDEAALAVASEALAQADPSLRVARYRGFLAQKLGDFDGAIAAYEHILRQAPDDFETWNNLGNARAGLGDHAGAVEGLRQAMRLDPEAAPVRLNLATALIALDRPDEAQALLEQALHDFPQDPRAAFELYVLHKRAERQEPALAALEAAGSRDPASADYQLKLGIEYGLARRTEGAERAYRRAISLDPGLTDAYLGLAVQYEHTNREGEFAPLAALARDSGADPGAVALIEALDLRRAGSFEPALARMADVPETIEPERAEHIRATLLDRLGRTNEAYAAYAAANHLLEASPTDPLARAAALRDKLDGEIALLTPEWRDGWRAVEPVDARFDQGRPDPVFLVGFPRSGTTLLDTILMGHRRAVVLEEQPPLNLVDDMIGGMAALPDLDATAIAAARDRYFVEVAKVAEVGPDQLLIDKSPLFLYRLPLIRRLFPRARIILAMRHPCDVVLSCFMSNFRLNSAMSNFLRLEDAAAFYDRAFTHWIRAAELFAPDSRTIVYERLIEDVGAEVRPLFDWLGLEWDESVLDHTSTARARGLITTASYSQVTEPIYKRAAGRWERYRAHLDVVLPVLRPWVEHFGYPSL
ncbi:sulfotransferase [Novosphingobium sp. PS1R-30]|uniref:Sulfotransferase n=1 Tax=Novosphingobium anseongense TaxID=3133436 RepID=A0ABU8RVZ3_9SPHN